MTVLKIELINPKARMLLEELANLDLIRIQGEEETSLQFLNLLSKFRTHDNKVPSLEEIAQEVDAVRHQIQQGNE